MTDVKTRQSATKLAIEPWVESRFSNRGTMRSYSICGYTFHSSISIPELDPASELQPEFAFRLCTSPKDFFEPSKWLNHWYSSDQTIWLAIAQIEAGYLLRFPEFADFVISSDTRTIRCYPSPDIPLETIRHLLLNQVIPIVLSQLGKIVLHAAACATPLGAIAFLGTSGAGKSTLAASFGLRDFPVLSDDCLLLEEREGRVVVVPSYPGLRLWPESILALFDEQTKQQPVAHYTEKKRILVEQDQLTEPVLLSAIYVLVEPEDNGELASVSIARLAPSQAIFEAIRHTFQLDASDYARLRQRFKHFEWLAKSVPFFRLAYPREYTGLASVNLALLSHLMDKSIKHGT